MKITKLLLLSIVAGIVGCTSTSNQSPYEAQIDELMSKMTIEEKIGQMTQLSIDVIGKGNDVFSSHFPFQLDTVMMDSVFTYYKVGSILNQPSSTPLDVELWNKVVVQINEIALKSSSIPVVYGIDAVHGVNYTIAATLFPQQIAMAATFNRDLVRQGAEVTAYEARASNLPWNFSPVLDLGRNQAWPRLWEGYGEDTYVTSELGVACVEGYQGKDYQNISQNNIAACLKHYMGYGAPASGKDRTPAAISEADLREHHFEPFLRAVVDGKALSVMVNSGIVNGESVHASHRLIQQMLKDELNFDGVVVTDWQDINNLYTRDKIAETKKDAIVIAINAGIDMAMVPYDVKFCTMLKEAVEQGEVSQKRIDDAVRRVLRMKFRLGLFDKPNTLVADYPKFGDSTSVKLSYESAGEAITLLKNKDSILPLSGKMRVLVTGPNANSMRSLNGGWTLSWQGEKIPQFINHQSTILDNITKMVGKENVIYEPYVTYPVEKAHFADEFVGSEQKLLAAAQRADIIIACLGENSYTEMPGDIDNLEISKNQQRLVEIVSKANKPIVMVLNEGRPRVISNIEPLANAIVQTYLPGTYGAEALVDILWGNINPSGKLPYTYPKNTNALLTYDYKPSENAEKMDGAYDYMSSASVQWFFGFGMSYTSFVYGDMKINKDSFNPSEIVEITIPVTNVGKRDGKETVLLYSSDLVAKITPDVRRLRGFEKVSLKAGETKEVKFRLPVNDLAYVGLDGKWILEAGKFNLVIDNKVKGIEVLKTKIWDTALRN